MNDHSLQSCNTGRASRRLGALALVSACLSSACGSERLSLGAGEAPLELGEPACGGGVVHGSVEVHDQLEVEALAGCEEIVGNLWLHAFSGVDLRPLSSLRIVRGDLAVGPNDSGFELVESLEGLEALEQVSRLSIHYLGSTDLAPLSNLKRVELDPLSPWDEGGSIDIEGCPNLIDLTGLGGLERWDELLLQDNESLASLNGLAMPALGSPRIRGNVLPALRDLSALASLESASMLQLSSTGLAHIAPLGLTSVSSLDLTDNDALIDIDGLANLETIDGFTLRENDALDHLPDWPALRRLSGMQIVDNAALTSIPAYATESALGRYELGSSFGARSNPDVLTLQDFTLIDIGGNPKLTRLTLPSGFQSGRYIGVYDNPNLTSLDLGRLTQLEQLSIRGNATLESVALGGLVGVDVLAVENNPKLPSAAFANLLSFERVITGNAGDAP